MQTESRWVRACSILARQPCRSGRRGLFFRLFSSLFFSFFIASFFAFFSRNFVLFFFLGDEREAEHKQQADSEEALHDGGYYQKVNC